MKLRRVAILVALVLVFGSTISAKVFKRQVNGSHEIEEEEEEEDENCGVVTPSVRHYIHGGKQTMIEQWPWQLHLKIADKKTNRTELLNKDDYANCGAAIINERWIITASHCFTNRHQPSIFLLSGFNLTNNKNYKLVKYEKIITHPSYKEYFGTQEYSTNDIALIKLATNERLPATARPCLPNQNAILPVNSICYITGYGAHDRYDSQQVKHLKEGRVSIKGDEVCRRTLQLDEYDASTMICAGKTRKKMYRANSCLGDSGGPLVCEGSFDPNKTSKWYLFGITSFGALDCDLYPSSVYTKVSKYVDWIKKTISSDI